MKTQSMCCPLVIAAVAAVMLMIGAINGSAAEPIGWRNDGSGSFSDCQPPTHWSKDTRVLWKTDMPGQSMSSPVVVGSVVVTTAEPAELIGVHAEDGAVVWKRMHDYGAVFDAAKIREIESQHAAAAKIRQQIEQLQKKLTDLTTRDPDSVEKQSLESAIADLQKQYEAGTPYPPIAGDGVGNATATPITDGKAIWTTFATGIVSSHDLEGNRNWIQFLEKPTGRYTSSPVLVGNRLIVHFNHLTALDAANGNVLWQTDSPTRNGTPVTARVGTTDVVITPSGTVIRVADGRTIAEKLFDLAYCSPISRDGIVYAIERGAMKAIELKEQGAANVTATLKWEERGAEDDRLASPVLHAGVLYSISGKGILDAVQADSGKRVYRKRLEFGQARADPSLAIAGDLLFISSNEGRTFVIKPTGQYEEISRNDLEGFSSSPFFHASRAYIRTPKHLYCIGE